MNRVNQREKKLCEMLRVMCVKVTYDSNVKEK